jgi:hypothetical protein
MSFFRTFSAPVPDFQASLVLYDPSVLGKAMARMTEVRVKLTQADMALFRRAAEKRWPEAEIDNPGLVLGLARIAVRDILGKTTEKSSMASPPGRRKRSP